MTINVDITPVDDEQEALRLMLHHLKLAAAYFEATPTTWSFDKDHFSAPAIAAWGNAMEALYPPEDE